VVMRRTIRAAIAAMAAVLVPFIAPATAQALPLTQPDPTAMVNGPVRTIAQAGSVVWVGGSFTQANDPAGSPVAVDNLIPVSDTTGLLDVSLQIPSVTWSGGAATVFDSSLGPDGVLYLAGTFSAVNGSPRHNVAAIDPSCARTPRIPPSATSSRKTRTRSSRRVSAMDSSTGTGPQT